MDAKDIRNLSEAYMEVYASPEQLDEISQKTATKAYAARATGEYEYDTNPSDQTKSGKYKSDVARERIKKKFGKKAAAHADRAAHAQIFGRKGAGGMPSVKEDVYDIILSHLLDEGYAETPEAAQVIMVNMSEEWRQDIMEGMTMKDFKANRQKNKRRAASADAEKRGHVGKEWYNSGRKYSPDEAKRMRSKLNDEERRTRHRTAVDPDDEDDNNYSADKTKNPKKLRKQRAMGEHG